MDIEKRIKQLEAEKADLVKWLRDQKRKSYEKAFAESNKREADTLFGMSAAYVKTLNFINNQNK